MNDDELKRTIEAKKGSLAYSSWTVGITTNPAERKKEHASDGKHVGSWSDWDADSKRVAQNVEAYFLGKGMNGGTGGDIDGNKTVYVYVF